MLRTFFLLIIFFGVALNAACTQSLPLKSPNNQGQYIIIAHPQFAHDGNLQRFVAWRQSKGYQIRVITTTDITKEFSETPATLQRDALRSFVSYALQYWKKPSPTYFLLVGSADHIPSYRVKVTDPLFTTPELLRYEDSVSMDEMFVVNKYLAGQDTRPQAALGRFPVRDAEGLQNIIDKTIRFEDYGQWLGYKTDFVGVTDSTDADMFETSMSDFFEYTGAWQAKVMHRDLRLKEVNYRPKSLHAGTRTDLFNAVNAGTVFLTYYGHGATDLWSVGRILTTGDIDTVFKPDGKPFIMMSVGCSQNFDAGWKRSIVERLITFKGGAVATYASAGFSDLSEGNGLLKSVTVFMLQNPDIMTIGMASLQAKQLQYYPINAPEDYVFRRPTLLGDPALKLPSKLITAVRNDPASHTQALAVQMFPNPTSDQSTLTFTASEVGTATLEVFTVLGQSITERSLAIPAAGAYSIVLDLNAVESGIYNYRLRFGSGVTTGLLRVVR